MGIYKRNRQRIINDGIATVKSHTLLVLNTFGTSSVWLLPRLQTGWKRKHIPQIKNILYAAISCKYER